jgi:hypothetical protein
MNWDAIGAIAETLGAVGVIASLVYLATQIRHSRDQMSQNTRASGYQSFFQSMDEVAMRSTSSPKMAEALRLGITHFDQLDEEQAFYFNNWMLGMFMAFENGHYQFRTGILDESRWRLHRSNLTACLNSPGPRQWWRQNPLGRDTLDPEFFALVEEVIGESGGFVGSRRYA